MPLVGKSPRKAQAKKPEAQADKKAEDNTTKPKKYIHTPQHAATDAIIGAPPYWTKEDKSKILAAHADRLERESSNTSTPSIPRVHSSLSCVSYPFNGANPVVSVSKSYHYQDLPGSLSGTPSSSFCASVPRAADSITVNGPDTVFTPIWRQQSGHSATPGAFAEQLITTTSVQQHSSRPLLTQNLPTTSSTNSSGSSPSSTGSGLEMRCLRADAEDRPLATDSAHKPTLRDPATRSKSRYASKLSIARINSGVDVGSRYPPEAQPIVRDFAYETLAAKPSQVHSKDISSRSLRITAAQTRVRASSGSSNLSTDNSQSMLWTKILQLPPEAEPIVRDFAYSPLRAVSQLTSTEAISSQQLRGRQGSSKRTSTSRPLRRSNAVKSSAPSIRSKYVAMKPTCAQPLTEPISESDECSVDSNEEYSFDSVEAQSTAPTSKTNSFECLNVQEYEPPRSTDISQALSAAHPEAVGPPLPSHCRDTSSDGILTYLDESQSSDDLSDQQPVAPIYNPAAHPARPTRFQEGSSLCGENIGLEYLQTPKNTAVREETDFSRLMAAHDEAVRKLRPKKSRWSWLRKIAA